MKVKDLIETLKQYPQDLDVVSQLFSEHVLLEADDLTTAELCLPRPDGWVANARPDKPSQPYLIFAGN